MAKIHRTVSIDTEIGEAITEHGKTGFNFSEWVEREYYHQFMSEQSKEEQIKKLHAEIEKIRERRSTFTEALSVMEKRFINEVPRLIAEGKEMGAICRRFNNVFHRDFDVAKFKSLVQVLRSEKC